MDKSGTIVYNPLYCKALAIASKNNILIATRHLYTTANNPKEYYYRVYKNSIWVWVQWFNGSIIWVQWFNN